MSIHKETRPLLMRVGFLDFYDHYPEPAFFKCPAAELDWILLNIRYRKRAITKTFVARMLGLTVSAVEAWLKPYRGAKNPKLGRDMPERNLRLFKLEMGLLEPFYMSTRGEAAWNVKTVGSEKPLPPGLKVDGLS